jgi:PAS domain S-box-containing protein
MKNFKSKPFQEFATNALGVDAFITALEASSIVSVSDINGNILRGNELFYRTFGYNESEIVGLNYRIFNSGYHSKKFFQDMWEKIKKKEIWKGEVCNLTAHGEKIWLETSIIPILNDDDEIKYFVTVRQNITELKNQQEENWKQLQFQASINNSSTNIIFRCDLKGYIDYVNKAFQLSLGFDSSEVLFTKSPNQFISPDCIRRRSEEIFSSYNVKIDDALEVLLFRSKKNLVNSLEWTMLAKNGSFKSYHLKINYYFDQEQNPVGFIFIGEDISDRKEVERQLQINKNEAEKTIKIKNELLSRLSHLIKTPLNGILGMVDCLEHTDLNTEQKEYVEIIQKSSARLLSTINKTIELNKIESNAISLNEKNFSLSMIVEELKQKYQPICEAKKLDFKIENRIEENIFFGDEKRIVQVLNYFLENAVRFTEIGMISLELAKNEDGLISFSVRDTGKGISEETANVIFESFSYEKSNIQSDYNGMGISLSLSKKIANLLNAEIGCKSSLGFGSLFWLNVPLQKVDPIGSMCEIEAKIINVENLKVLVVEDDVINQRLLKKMLNRQNIYPEVVSNGLEAIEIQRKEHFDLIFMDVNMPIMDGLEATSIMRANKDVYGNPRIIAVTANSVTGDEEICIKAGMDDYISKPIKREALEKLINKILGVDNTIKKMNTKKSNAKFYIQKLLKDFSGDEEILSMFIESIINKIPARIDQLEIYIKNDNFILIQNESNNLKDLVTSLHHEILRQYFESFEEYGKAKKHRNILPMFEDLKKELDLLIVELKTQFISEAA